MARLAACAGCGGRFWIDQVDITGLGDAVHRVMDGVHEPCNVCGTAVEAVACPQKPERYPVTDYGVHVLVPVYCGPAATRPSVPSHAEWMTGVRPVLDQDWRWWINEPPAAGV